MDFGALSPSILPFTLLVDRNSDGEKEKSPRCGRGGVNSRERVSSAAGSVVLWPGAAPERRHPDRDVSAPDIKPSPPPELLSQRLCLEEPETLYLGQSLVLSAAESCRNGTVPPIGCIRLCTICLCANPVCFNPCIPLAAFSL